MLDNSVIRSLRNQVKSSLQNYFTKLDGTETANLYQLVINEVEKPLIDTVMHYAKGNQTKAAKWLGISRNTLRKLLIEHNSGTI